jgi:hypothetical protein
MMRVRRRDKLELLANEAINQTLSRTIIAAGLTFLTVLSLLLFGGEVLKSFSWALFIGIIIGTYSSIYIASPFMLWWEGFRKQPKLASVALPGGQIAVPAGAAGLRGIRRLIRAERVVQPVAGSRPEVLAAEKEEEEEPRHSARRDEGIGLNAATVSPHFLFGTYFSDCLGRFRPNQIGLT